MTRMPEIIETRGSEATEGRVNSAAETPAQAAQAGVPPAPQGAVIAGDPREDEKVFEQLVDAVRDAFNVRDVVFIALRFEDSSIPDYLTLARPLYGGRDYIVVMDEDGRPLYVIDRTAQTWDEAVADLLSFAGKDAERITEVTVELGERW